MEARNSVQEMHIRKCLSEAFYMEISRILNFDFILVLLFCPIVVAIVTLGSHCVAQCLSLLSTGNTGICH